jgi:hypothetical protein
MTDDMIFVVPVWVCGRVNPRSTHKHRERERERETGKIRSSQMK